MKDEIKEILEALKPHNNIVKEYPLTLSIEKQKILLDYITNLQEKYERMKENATTLSNGYNELEQRNEKAIEYILKLDKDYDINVYQEDKHWAMVLYILQGEDKDVKNKR